MKNSSLKQVKDFQEKFTRHIRNPQKYKKPPSVSARRMKVYNELLFNSVEDCLNSCFPILKSILKKKWKVLVRSFFEKHSAQSPLYREIPQEFVDYLMKFKKIPRGYPAFLTNLAHYEWMELSLFLMPDSNSKNFLTPIHALLEYDYPVHQLHLKSQLKTPKKSYYFLYRNPQDEIESLVLNPVSARLLQLLKEGKKPQRALERVIRELKHPNPQEVLKEGKKLLKEWENKKIILT